MATILIVDDNKTLQQSYATFLQNEGYTIATASTVAEALEYLATNTPQLILLDMLLPKVNGLELLQQYDIREAHKDVKVIAFSNLSELRIQEEAQSLGVNLYLDKSRMTPDELVGVVQRTLSE